MAAASYDFIIIGTGQSGKPLALALGRAGRKTAIIEREYVGGTCINYGCTPTKTMVASARAAFAARRAGEYGVNAGSVSVDVGKAVARKDAIVQSFRRGGQEALEKAENVELLFGEASVQDKRTVLVKLNEGGERTLSAETIVINTGGSPLIPPIPGLIDAPVCNSTTIMEVSKLPEHLLVLGGGYIALEFGQMFRRLGSRVSVVEKEAHLVSREDPDVCKEVEEILREDGLELHLGATAVKVETCDDGQIGLVIKANDGEKTLCGSHLLVAIGRVPNTKELNLGVAGVETDDKGYIKVNPKLETSVPGIYAMGDVKGGPAFTHISYDDFRVLRENLVNGGSATVEGRLVPNTTFIDPQLASIGLNETEAKRQGRKVRVAKLPMSSVARAIEVSETRGFMKAIVDAKTDQILGCTILGIEGGEIMSMIEIAMMGKLPYTALKEAIFAHPTLAESLNNLFMTLD
ncbi:MAG TPA: mercuric reductase [Burkholderiales bacterium]|nr:mercuric reductase [Burkholderiales bacterium]